jgi:hypothetical protein
MNMRDLLQGMLDDLKRTMAEDEGPEIPTGDVDEAAAIVGEERRLEREAARAANIDRFEILVYQPRCMGTLRFHGDTGHLHGMLWAEKSPGQWTAFPFAGQLAAADPRPLMARLRELGSPYHDQAGGAIPPHPKAGSHGPVRYDTGNGEGE